MATEDIDRLCYNVLDCSITGKLEPPLARLGNCLAANHNAKLVYCLGDNNVVMVLQVSQDATVPVIQDDTSIPCGPNIELQRKLQLQNEELECHCLSNDENVIGIAGKSVHLFNPQLNSININEINLNYVPKSITITCHDNSQSCKVYNMAIAGPNGVNIYILNSTNHKLNTHGVINLHTGLPIAIVQYSRNGHYLAVATMDSHFGVWKNTAHRTFDAMTDFWYIQVKTIRVTSIKFSPTRDMVAVGCWDQNIFLYQLENVQPFCWSRNKLEFNFELYKVINSRFPGVYVQWSNSGIFLIVTIIQDCKTTVLIYNTDDQSFKEIATGDIIKGIASGIDTLNNEYILFYTRQKKLRLIYF